MPFVETVLMGMAAKGSKVKSEPMEAFTSKIGGAVRPLNGAKTAPQYAGGFRDLYSGISIPSLSSIKLSASEPSDRLSAAPPTEAASTAVIPHTPGSVHIPDPNAGSEVPPAYQGIGGQPIAPGEAPVASGATDGALAHASDFYNSLGPNGPIFVLVAIGLIISMRG